MDTLKILRSLFIVTFCLLFNLPTLLATDGYFALGYSAKHKALAGAGIGLYQYSLIGGNPAGHAFIGNKYEIGVSIFMPFRQYTVTGDPSGIPGFFGLTPGTVESDSKVFPIPYLGANWMLGPKMAIGVSIYGNGGMNTNYPTQSFYDQSISTTGVNMAQLFAEISFAYKLNEQHSVGLAAVLAYQYFKVEGVSSFANFSSDPMKLSNNGTDNSVGNGLKFGYMGQFMDRLHIGAQFQTKLFMSEFDNYAGLFAEQGDFDIPMNWTVGVAYDISDQLTVALDVKQIYYSKVASVGNPMDLVNNAPADQQGNPNPDFQPLGSDDAWGFGWEDMTVLKFGASYDMNEDWTLRAGFSHGKQPVPSTEVLFNIMAPGVIDNHLALGISKKLTDNKFDFFINYAFTGSVNGPNPLDFDPVELLVGNFVYNQDIELQMYQFDFGIGYSF